MKMNVFAEAFTLGMHVEEEDRITEPGGHKAIDVFDTESELVEDIDKPKYTTEQWRAKKFLEFLGNRRLSIDKLKQLDTQEQKRIRQEFLETFEA